MSDLIPFLRPRVPTVDEYLPYLRQMDESHLYSNYGPLNTRFESEIVTRLFGGDGHALTVNNATSGLALATRMTARPDGRYVIMPSFTFAATPLAAIWAGFEPYFVDVDADTWMVSEAAVEDALAELGEDVAAVMPYATFGNNLDLTVYRRVVAQGIPVVVDAAASLGSVVDGAQFGAGFPGTVVFSMHATKPFSVGEAGLIYSADSDVIATLRRAGNFGFGADRSADLAGFNTKLSEMAAAVALATLDSFDERMKARAATHAHYSHVLAEHLSSGWAVQQPRGEVVHQFFPLLAPENVDGNAVVAHLEAEGIQARRYFAPACHEQPVFAGYRRGDLSVTQELARRIVSLPLWDGLDDASVRRIAGALPR